MGNIIALIKASRITQILFIIGIVILTLGGVIGGAIMCWVHPGTDSHIAAMYFRETQGWAVIMSMPFFLLAVFEVFIKYSAQQALDTTTTAVPEDEAG